MLVEIDGSLAVHLPGLLAHEVKEGGLLVGDGPFAGVFPRTASAAIAVVAWLAVILAKWIPAFHGVPPVVEVILLGGVSGAQ